MSKGLGKRQNAIWERLKLHESFPLLEFVRQDLGREPTVPEYNSTHRAARKLEGRGLCRLATERLLDGRRPASMHSQPQVVVYRPGTGPAVSVKTRPTVREPRIRERLAGDIVARRMRSGESEDDAAVAIQVQAMAFADGGRWAKSTAGSFGYAYVGDQDNYPEDILPPEYYDLDDDYADEADDEPWPPAFEVGLTEATLHDYDDPHPQPAPKETHARL